MDNPNTPSFPFDVGARLKLWRRNALQLTQDEVASMLQINPTGYRKYELGRHSPGAAVLAAACCNGLNVNWLLTGQDHMLLRDATTSYSTDDHVLERLCTVLDRLRTLDPEKYKLLASQFVLRSEEALDHAKLKHLQLSSPESMPSPNPALNPPKGLEDILSAPFPNGDEIKPPGPGGDSSI